MTGPAADSTKNICTRPSLAGLYKKNLYTTPGPAEGRPGRPALKEMLYFASADLQKESVHGLTPTVDSTQDICTRLGLPAVLQKIYVHDRSCRAGKYS